MRIAPCSGGPAPDSGEAVGEPSKELCMYGYSMPSRAEREFELDPALRPVERVGRGRLEACWCSSIDWIYMHCERPRVSVKKTHVRYSCLSGTDSVARY